METLLHVNEKNQGETLCGRGYEKGSHSLFSGTEGVLFHP